MKRISITFLAVAGFLMTSTIAEARRPHFVGSPTCSQVGEQLCCSGKVAGLGTAPTTVQVSATFSCVNRGGHEPGGHVSGQSAPIQPRGGQITFADICTGVGDCPPPMTPSFGGGAAINIFQNGNLVFSATIPIQ